MNDGTNKAPENIDLSDGTRQAEDEEKHGQSSGIPGLAIRTRNGLCKKVSIEHRIGTFIGYAVVLVLLIGAVVQWRQYTARKAALGQDIQVAYKAVPAGKLVETGIQIYPRSTGFLWWEENYAVVEAGGDIFVVGEHNSLPVPEMAAVSAALALKE